MKEQERETERWIFSFKSAANDARQHLLDSASSPDELPLGTSYNGV
jgi:hypothetical protein